MTEKTTQDNRIKGYGLDRPTAAYAISSLERFLGVNEAQDLWSRACESCEVQNTDDDLSSLELIFKYLSKEPGAVGVLGRSLVIRTVSYRTLSRNKTIREQKV